MRSVIFSKYQLRGSEDNLSLVARRLWPGKLEIRLHDVNQVVIYRDLLVIRHDGGEACLTQPQHPRHQALYKALYAVHGIHIVESDRRRLFDHRLAQAGGAAFIVIVAVIVAGAIYLTIPPEGGGAEAGIFVIYLLPGLCLAYLARWLLQKII